MLTRDQATMSMVTTTPTVMRRRGSVPIDLTIDRGGNYTLYEKRDLCQGNGGVHGSAVERLLGSPLVVAYPQRHRVLDRLAAAGHRVGKGQWNVDTRGRAATGRATVASER